MRNATTTYSLSIGTDLDAYKDPSDHHYMSTQNLVITSPDQSYFNTDGEEYGNGRRTPQWDYSGLRDPDAFRWFQSAVTYFLTFSNDSSEGDYDPACECFVVVFGEGKGEVGGR
jgi:hypothetical protein